jgi:hypothetical protein
MNMENEMCERYAKLAEVFSKFPARLNAPETAKRLGVSDHDIPVLIDRGFLKPLGTPARNAPKYFATVNVLEIAADGKTLDRASRALNEYWAKKNQRRTKLVALPRTQRAAAGN